jgi:signal transduction histidine kinase
MKLVVNARDAMPHGGHLRIGLAQLQVSDAGARRCRRWRPANGCR